MLNQPIKPMLLESTAKVRIGPGQRHMLKYDGFRAILHYDEGTCRLFTRHGNLVSISFPEIQSIRLPVKNCIFDCEMISFSDTNATSPVPYPDFDKVMARFKAKTELSIKKLLPTHPCHLPAFDLIYLNGKSITHETFDTRYAMLQEIVKPTDILSVTPTYEDGEALFEQVKLLGFEGITTRHANSTYRLSTTLTRGSRSPLSPNERWYKTKNWQYAAVHITGIQKGEFGCLMQINGQYVGVLKFASPAARKRIYQHAYRNVRSETADWMYFDAPLPCTVKFQCYNSQGHMRTASFIKFIDESSA